MAIPLPVKENFPSAFVAWRLYEPDDSRISGLAIVKDENQAYWSVNYTYVGRKFVEPLQGNVSKVRPILQSKTPPNTVLKRVSVVTIPTGEDKWQAIYKVVSQLSATTQAEVEIESRNIVSKVITDVQTGINISVELTAPIVQETVREESNLSTDTGTFKGCELQDKVATLKLIKGKVKTEMVKPSSGKFISNKHKNKFFALLRIARKAIVNKVTTSIKTETQRNRQTYGKGATIYEKSKYSSVPPPNNLNLKPNLKYFEKSDLGTVVAMGLLYDDPNKYFHGNYTHYQSQAHLWAVNTLMRSGIPIFSKEEGSDLFPHVMARTGLSEAQIQSIGVSSHTVNKTSIVQTC